MLKTSLYYTGRDQCDMTNLNIIMGSNAVLLSFVVFGVDDTKKVTF